MIKQNGKFYLKKFQKKVVGNGPSYQKVILNLMLILTLKVIGRSNRFFKMGRHRF